MREVTDLFAIGYAMGLIVGEGSFAADSQQPYLSVKLHSSDPLPLTELQRVLGGKLYGPYCSVGRTFRVWMLRGRDLLDAVPWVKNRAFWDGLKRAYPRPTDST
jgi:hypothetical protein